MASISRSGSAPHFNSGAARALPTQRSDAASIPLPTGEAERDRLRDLTALALLAACAFVIAALLTFDPADPPVPSMFPPHARATNACGFVGSLVAGALYQWLGLGAWFVLGLVATLDLMMLKRRSLADLPLRALGAAVTLGALSLSPGSAQAACDPSSPANTCRVTVGGLQYDVTTFTGSYNSNSALLSSQPWFEDLSLAQTVSGLVADGLGTPNTGIQGFPASEGPYFAYDFGSNQANLVYWRSGNVNVDGIPGNEPQHTWATATVLSASTPAPGPLPLFGAAAAFGFSRKLRKRIKL
ncbi:MAG: DNA translocase FtsK 4TM domain-containing protein, partial [Planctomycetota bacterium]